ncbi:beta-lactamase [Xylariaceae sp. FL0255]|nr:beta-lactamase [Xylariaceae sp. FL0255]
MAILSGKCDPKFTDVRTLLKHAISAGDELGASIVVNIDGEEVVDLWGGFIDTERSKPWEEDTIVNVWSSTKCLTSLTVLKLVEQGVLDLEEKVATYWPEFAANGKENILVRHLLAHASGLPGWEEPITQEGVCDFDAATDALARQRPWWEPGTASGYHPVTFGHLLGGLVRKATKGTKTLSQLAAEEIAGPLGADFQIGASKKDWPRVSPIYPPTSITAAAGTIPPDSIAFKVFMNPLPDGEFANTETFRLAESGANNGHANARGMNRAMSAITLGGIARGVRILQPETVELIFKEQYNGLDLTSGNQIRYGIGFGLVGEAGTKGMGIDDFVPPGKICYWGGWGGSMIIMDLSRKLTITYAMNKMYDAGLGSENTKKYVRAIYRALGV